jgi:hypothetical protein
VFIQHVHVLSRVSYFSSEQDRATHHISVEPDVPLLLFEWQVLRAYVPLALLEFASL